MPSLGEVGSRKSEDQRKLCTRSRAWPSESLAAKLKTLGPKVTGIVSLKAPFTSSSTAAPLSVNETISPRPLWTVPVTVTVDASSSAINVAARGGKSTVMTGRHRLSTMGSWVHEPEDSQTSSVHGSSSSQPPHGSPASPPSLASSAVSEASPAVLSSAPEALPADESLHPASSRAPRARAFIWVIIARKA